MEVCQHGETLLPRVIRALQTAHDAHSPLHLRGARAATLPRGGGRGAWLAEREAGGDGGVVCRFGGGGREGGVEKEGLDLGGEEGTDVRKGLGLLACADWVWAGADGFCSEIAAAGPVGFVVSCGERFYVGCESGVGTWGHFWVGFECAGEGRIGHLHCIYRIQFCKRTVLEFDGMKRVNVYTFLKRGLKMPYRYYNLHVLFQLL